MPEPVTYTRSAAAPKLCVVVDEAGGERAQAACAYARELGVPLYEPDALPAGFDVVLALTARRWELRVLRGDKALVGGHGVASELCALDTTSGPGRSLGQPLLKAVGIKRRNPYRPRVLDVTAGLGEDAWVLASVGCEVSACERNPVTYALLADGLRRAGESHPDIAGRIDLTRGEGVSVLRQTAKSDPALRPNVVYLDPMFPPGRKAAERKAMRVLRMVSGDDPDADRLLCAALEAATDRVVVKRPLHGPPLPGVAPTVCHKGKSLRFDVYPIR